MPLHPLAMDAMGSACCLKAKVQRDMLKETPANAKQEFMMAFILPSQPVDPRKAQESLKATPQVVMVVTQPSPKSQPSSSSSFALVKPKSAPQQASSQTGLTKLKDKSSTSMPIVASGKSRSFQGHFSSQKPEGSSSCSSFYKSLREH